MVARKIFKNISQKDIDINQKEAYNKGIGSERIREKPKGEYKMKRLIYAEDAMSRIEAETRFYSGTYAEIERAIDAAPTIDPESLRPTAHWENEDDFYGDSIVWFCSVCKGRFILNDGTPEENDYKYCPHCGAKMYF